MHHARPGVPKDPTENAPGSEAREAIQIAESLMCFHDPTLAQFLARVKPAFSLFYGLKMVVWSFTPPTQKPEDPLILSFHSKLMIIQGPPNPLGRRLWLPEVVLTPI